MKKEDESVAPPVEIKRELTPELAKFSALVTGQPKPKSMPPPVAPPISKTSCFVMLFVFNTHLLIKFATISSLYFENST